MLQNIGKLTTDSAGAPQQWSSLDANAEYLICVDKPVPSAGRVPSREWLASWIDLCVLGDLRTLRAGVYLYLRDGTGRDRLGGGNFLLAAGCCMAVEYLAQVYGKGADATTAARRWVNDFMQHEPRYSETFGIIWASFRNGIVHGSFPQMVSSEDRPLETIAVGASSAGSEHLASSAFHATDNFVLSGEQFLDDIQRAFDSKFQAWILTESDDDALERAAPRLVRVRAGDKSRRRELDVIRRMNADRVRLQRVRDRAYFLWESKTGNAWWDSASNWFQAETEVASELSTTG